MSSIVLVGAGVAAQRCCHALRRLGHDGPITLVGDEGRLPYDRPPLSKEHLHGDGELALRPRGWYDDLGVELRLGEPATGLDVARRRVRLASGEQLPYDRVLIATGARPVRLPGLERAHVLRTAVDAAALRDELRPGARLAVVGAGFVGLEVAATARALGVDVTLLEAAPAPLFGVLGPRLGAYFADWHRREGVRVVTGATAAPAPGEYDVLLVAVGVRPALAWLPGGVVPDDPHVFAAGDAAGGHHWEAAVAGGVAAAHAMLGRPAPSQPRPSFWSDQYGTRIQFAGDARGHDAVAVRGDPAARDFTALFLRDGVVRAGLLVGRPRALPALRDQLDHPPALEEAA
jgi:NADPH-dependent 2,4-dienoyl-CoA reductase/sulfur reductase-like enzyme